VGDIDTLSVPHEDRAVLRESIRRCGAVFYAEVPDGEFQAVSEVLESAGAVDFEEREAAWRREGWTGAIPASTTGTPAEGAATARTLGERSEERIPVVEERLRVGKRETSHGRIRIRSYVVETPVQEQVTLREERVHVERRPVDRPVGAADDAQFRERTIEATETGEEAVVSKEARVKEEVVVRKEAEERTQTVSDTVRRTEVKVEDERSRTDPKDRRDRG